MSVNPASASATNTPRFGLAAARVGSTVARNPCIVHTGSIAGGATMSARPLADRGVAVDVDRIRVTHRLDPPTDHRQVHRVDGDVLPRRRPDELLEPFVQHRHATRP